MGNERLAMSNAKILSSVLLPVLISHYSQWGLLHRLILPYRVNQEVKRQAKQLDAVLWRGGSSAAPAS
jgi:hypothetical protein